MGLSANERAPAEFDVSAFVEIAQDPARYKQILTELAELKAGHAALDRRTQELDDRERAVEARGRPRPAASKPTMRPAPPS